MRSLCADPGCGGIAAKGRLYCGNCMRRARPHGEDNVTDVDAVLLGERIGRRGNMKYLIARNGLHDCILCGREALPGREYCSDRCRGKARNTGPALYVVGGVKASITAHCERLGMAVGTVYKRMKRGMTVEEALTAPVDEVMSERSKSKWRPQEETEGDDADA